MDVKPGGGGTVEVEEAASSSYPTILSFKDGSYVHLEAVPAPGYQFVNWSGDLSGSTNPTAIVIDCTKMITANFAQVTVHTLTIEVIGDGSTIPTVGTHSYSQGTVVSITAIPGSGWRFDSWMGDVTDQDLASTTVTMDLDKTLTANFSQAKPGWWFIGGTIAGVIIVGAVIWLAVRSRIA